jgi:hypothetical protein
MGFALARRIWLALAETSGTGRSEVRSLLLPLRSRVLSLSFAETVEFVVSFRFVSSRFDSIVLFHHTPLSSGTDALFDPLLQHQTGIIVLILGPTFVVLVPIGPPPSSQFAYTYSNHLDLGETETSATASIPTDLLACRQTGD